MSDYAAFSVPSQANAQAVTLSASSAQSTALAEGDWIVLSTVVAFVLRGANPTAVVNTCPAIPPNVYTRLRGIQEGDKLAFVAGGAGTAYLWPDR